MRTKITTWGKVAQSGIVISLLVSLALHFLEAAKSKQIAAKAQAEETTKKNEDWTLSLYVLPAGTDNMSPARWNEWSSTPHQLLFALYVGAGQIHRRNRAERPLCYFNLPHCGMIGWRY